jgi:hypothetical protein
MGNRPKQRKVYIKTLGEHDWTKPTDAVFTTNHVRHAIANGTRVIKVQSVEGDAHQDGSGAKVIGSLRTPKGIVYFVEWDDMPSLPVGVAAHRVQVA